MYTTISVTWLGRLEPTVWLGPTVVVFVSNDREEKTKSASAPRASRDKSSAGLPVNRGEGGSYRTYVHTHQVRWTSAGCPSGTYYMHREGVPTTTGPTTHHDTHDGSTTQPVSRCSSRGWAVVVGAHDFSSSLVGTNRIILVETRGCIFMVLLTFGKPIHHEEMNLTLLVSKHPPSTHHPTHQNENAQVRTL